MSAVKPSDVTTPPAPKIDMQGFTSSGQFGDAIDAKARVGRSYKSYKPGK